MGNWNEYIRWKSERDSELATARTATPGLQKATVESDVAVPFLQAAGVSLVSGLTLGGLTLFLGGPLADLHGLALWSWAGRLAGGGFLVSLAVCTIAFVRGHRRMVTEPLDMLWDRLNAVQPRPFPEPDRSPMVVRGYTQRDPLLIEGELAQEVASIEPEAAKEIVNLYKFVTRVWPTGNISREHCARLGFSRRTWEKYVGGRRGKHAGTESGRGLLARAGCVDQTSTGWQMVRNLRDVYAINEELAEYAEAKAQLVRLGPDGQTGTGQPIRAKPGPAPAGEGDPR